MRGVAFADGRDGRGSVVYRWPLRLRAWSLWNSSPESVNCASDNYCKRKPRQLEPFFL